MKTEALKLADELDEASELEADLNRPENQADLQKASAMIRRLVEELDKPHPRCDKACMYLCQTKPLSDEEILEISDKFIERFSYEPAEIDEIGFARAIEERHGIK